MRALPASGVWYTWMGPLAAIILLQTAVAFLLQLLPTTAPVLMRQLGWSDSTVGYLMALTMVSAIVCLQGSSPVVRGLGPVRAVQVGLLIGGAGAAILAAPLWIAPIATSVMVGFAYGPATPAGSDILHRFSPPRHRALIFSVKQAGVPLGNAAAGIILPWLVIGRGWHAAITFTVFLMVATAILVQPFRRLADGERPARAAGNVQAKGGLAAFLVPLDALRRGRGLLRLASVGGCLAIVQGVLNSFLVTWMVSGLHLDLHAAGIVFAVLQGGGIAGRLAFGWLADRLGSGVPVIRIAAVGSVASLLVLSQAGPEWPFALLVLFAGAAGTVVASWNGVQLSEIARRTPPGLIGETSAGATSFVFSGLVAGPAIFGLALAQFDRFDVIFAGFAAIPAAAFLLSLTVPPAREAISSS